MIKLIEIFLKFQYVKILLYIRNDERFIFSYYNCTFYTFLTIKYNLNVYDFEEFDQNYNI